MIGSIFLAPPDSFPAENETAARWYCIHTKRYKERWVTHQLVEVCAEVYLPLLRERRRVRRQEVWRIEPLFPSYVFARFALAPRFRAVRYTPGVLELVSGREGEPLEVEPLIITALRERSPQGWLEVQPPPFVPGEELEVVDGPFQGLRALFQQELRGGERVAVLLELLSSHVRVELPRTCLRKKLNRIA